MDYVSSIDFRFQRSWLLCLPDGLSVYLIDCHCAFFIPVSPPFLYFVSLIWTSISCQGLLLFRRNSYFGLWSSHVLVPSELTLHLSNRLLPFLFSVSCYVWVRSLSEWKSIYVSNCMEQYGHPALVSDWSIIGSTCRKCAISCFISCNSCLFVINQAVDSPSLRTSSHLAAVRFPRY